MPERFKVVCIPCKALYKCFAFPLPHCVLVYENRSLIASLDKQASVSVSRRCRGTSRSRLGLISVSGFNVSFHKLIFSDRNLLKLVAVIGEV